MQQRSHSSSMEKHRAPAVLDADDDRVRADMPPRFLHLLGDSPAMQGVYDQLLRVAPTAVGVLLIGESGSGKELVARTLHDLSPRKLRPFVCLNCGTLTAHVVERKLRDAEDGEIGTLFLDEIAEIPPEAQIALLGALEEGVAAGASASLGSARMSNPALRIVAATKHPPLQTVANGRLREDLYHRLNVFPITLPPLRERGGDIELLALHFLSELNAREGTAKRFSRDSIAALYRYAWPGNVRELKNYVQRAFILADEIIDADLAPKNAIQVPPDKLLKIPIGSSLDDMNRRLIEATLLECGNVKQRAAEILGISLKTLYNRLSAYQRDR